jgi:excisionase family DNA binding protein
MLKNATKDGNGTARRNGRPPDASLSPREKARRKAQREEALTYTVEEARRRLGLGRNQIYQALDTGEIASIRIGRRWLVLKAALDRMLDGEPVAR